MRTTTSIRLLLPLFCAAFLLSACTNSGSGVVSPNAESPNILLIIADDLGKDALKGYAEGSIKPTTPNIDALRNNGLTFNNFWVNPTCTPTRASIITGKYGYRTGVKGVGDVLAQTETTLQKFISTNTGNKYASAIVGKWHLSGNDGNANPETFGIDYYAGLIRGAVDDYYRWQLTEDGTSRLQTKYATEVFTDLASDWVSKQTKPWFLWLAYNAPHTPFHVPPSTMHNQGNLAAYSNGVNPLPYYMAAIEAMDNQIGKLLEKIPTDKRNNTIIIVIGDNGTPDQVTQNPYSSNKVKNTLYQGGINVPMIISGKGVSRTGTENTLLNGTDLFATIAEIVGIATTQYQDSKSFRTLLTASSTTPIRTFQYAELADGSANSWAIRNEKYKLIINNNGSKEMYEMIADQYERTNLLNRTLTTAESSARTELETELANIRK